MGNFWINLTTFLSIIWSHQERESICLTIKKICHHKWPFKSYKFIAWKKGQFSQKISFYFRLYGHFVREEEVCPILRRSTLNSIVIMTLRIFPVWPNLAKFHQFGNILKVLCDYMRAYLVLGKNLNLLWSSFYAIGQILIVPNGLIFTNNLVIWSHFIFHSLRVDTQLQQLLYYKL